MFGNTTGWIISAIISVVAVFTGVKLIQMSQPTPPTGWVQENVKPLDLSAVAKPALDPMDNLKDDAGTLYRHAIADYEQNKSAYETLQKKRDYDEADATALAGLNDLITACGCEAMDLFKSKPDEVVGYDSTVAALDDLTDIAQTAQNVIALAKYDKHYDVARKYAAALAALGYHLYKERIAYCELSAGENFMGTGIAAMKSIAQDESADDKVRIQQAFDAARRDEYGTKIEPVIKVISGLGDAILTQYSGDMFELAADAQAERVWRVEAIRKIGRLRFNATNMADQLKAPRFLASLAVDTNQDAVIQAAAVKARDMTAYDNQSLR